MIFHCSAKWMSFLIHLLILGIICYQSACVPEEIGEQTSSPPILPAAEILMPETPIMQDESLYKIGFMHPKVSEAKACGTATGFISRTSYEFQALLIHYDNPLVVFKDEENYTLHYNYNEIINLKPFLAYDTDHYMVPHLAEKLETLAAQFNQLDPGLFVRVTESYDNNWEHGNIQRSSLHYYGRALDLNILNKRTGTRDLTYMPKLCEMAVQAGFDWVFYEDEQHLHVSVAPLQPEYPKIVFYDRIGKDFYSAFTFNMSNRPGGWALKTLEIDPGTYYFKFQDQGKADYGFRDKHVLGIDAQLSESYHYHGAPIAFDITERGLYEFRFNPNTLLFFIDGPGKIKYYNLNTILQVENFFKH